MDYEEELKKLGKIVEEVIKVSEPTPHYGSVIIKQPKAFQDLVKEWQILKAEGIIWKMLF